MSSVAGAVVAPEEFWGHPKGLYVCFFTEMWERFSFYGMKALLLLYLTKYHLFSDDHGYNLIGAYGGLVYAMPVIGGLLADRYLGMRKAVVFGGVLLCLGHFGMAFEGHKAALIDGVVVQDTQALKVFYLSLSLIILGVGFLKPNISTIVGKLYPDNDPRRDSGFSIYYAGINLGALMASLIAAWLGETFGWRFGFGAAGVGMLGGLLTFTLGQKHLLGHAEPKDPELLRQRIAGPLSREHLIYLISIASLFLIWLLIQQHSLMLQLVSWLPEMSAVLWAMHAISIVLLTWIFWFMFTRCNPVERQQMAVLLALIACCLIFFTLYEQTYGSWVLFSDRVMNRHFIIDWTAGQLTFLGAVFILALAPILSWLWPWLEKRGLNPSKPAKSGLGLVFAGLSFLALVWSARHPQENGMAGLWWFVLAYLVLEIGEMLLSPIGLAAVTQLSVPRVVGVMMGGWWLGTAYSEVFAALLGKLSSIEVPQGTTLNVAEALAKYDALFVYSAKIGVGCGLVILLLTPLLKRGMHGVK
jgi:POT family proton-dependent oligopeptide transporter